MPPHVRDAAAQYAPPAPAVPALPDLLLEHLDVGVLACDGRGVGTRVTGRARALLGLDAMSDDAGAFAAAMRAMSSADDAAWAPGRDPFARALRGEVVDGLRVSPAADGRARALRLTVRPLSGPDGATTGAVATLRAEDEGSAGERAPRALPDAHAAGELLARTGHELRTPLTAIRGALELVFGADGGGVAPERRPLVAIVRRNVETLQRVVNDLLDLERVESGVETMERAASPLAALLERVAHALDDVAAEAGVVVDRASDDAEVAVDVSRMEQALVNVLCHAIARTPRGGRVRVMATSDGRWADVVVTDDGPAIPPACVARAFARFEAPDLLGARPQLATGLGLAVSRAIVERHGGHLTLESEASGGARFRLRVPAGSPSASVPG